ncbi:unnamed protein product [Adineta steineri]|uniref:Uncharacterized protein n=1 Tax=Adineta steineri TaxID=433720 RepID=A0A818X0I1_9BILA|nr:unnamed protein product [Adineta steineri]CAF3749154.1 unnamed protein product [Adineta steineri]
MLYIPSEYALCVYDILMKQGKDYGVISTEYFTQRTLRTERIYPSWGHDIDKKTTPFHSNREYHISFDVKIKSNDKMVYKKRFVQFLLKDHNLDSDPWPWSSKPIYRNGEFCGFVTSAAFGFTLGKQDLFMHLLQKKITVDYIRVTTYEINIATKRFKARFNVYQPTEMDSSVLLYTN